MDKEEIKSEIEKRLGELQTLKDQLKVKMHLASMDAKSMWDEVSREIEQLKTEKARIVTNQVIDGLKHKLELIQEKLRSA